MLIPKFVIDGQPTFWADGLFRSRSPACLNELLLGTRALLLICIVVAAALAVVLKPDLATPILVGVAVLTLLMVVVGH